MCTKFPRGNLTLKACWKSVTFSVNELPLRFVNSMRMFADDTKLRAYIRSEADSNFQSLQDLYKLVEWSNGS